MGDGEAEAPARNGPRGPIADAVIVAAGSSSRMAGLDKLTAPLAGRPLLRWSVDGLAASPSIDRIVLVVAPGREAELARVAGDRVARVVGGGEHRGASVAAGVAALDLADRPDRVVLVHDGARPLVRPELADAVSQAAAASGAAIPAVPVAETVKRVRDGVVVETVDRAELATAQTPQGVRAGLLADAWRQFPPDGPRQFTDEAALLEACRIPVRLVPGDPSNLKVTVPADLLRAEALLGGAARRVGLGVDSHPFGPGGPLRLGGVVIDGAPRLHGHSDGDVALHAVADAILGAAGFGDLGRMFPADRRTPRGINSRDLLVEVGRRATTAGWRPAQVDLTITAARPRLGDRLDAMRAAIAEALELPEGAVNVKASTGNLDAAEGAGRVVSAQAIATLVAVSPAPEPVGEGSR